MNLQTESVNPFILTLAMNEEAAAFFNQQRQLYFPARINFLQAHLTLFHYVPLSAQQIIPQVQSIANETATFNISVPGVVSLGKGVAYKLESETLQKLHKRLQQAWKSLLKPQDLQKLWPHITVQNKVTPDEAKTLLDQLKTGFQPFNIQATGLSVWEYLNGPWKFIETVRFSSETHL